MSRWLDCYSDKMRMMHPQIAPEEFLKANGLNKFCPVSRYSTTNAVKKILHTGRWNLERVFNNNSFEKDIPYLDHGLIYKNSMNYGVLVYLPYIRYDKSLADMTDEIREWANRNGLLVSIIRESWYHPDAFVVIVTVDVSYMRELVINWNIPCFNGRITTITNINKWNI